MSILLGAIVIIVTLFYREILAVSYDSEYASLRGINVKFFYTLILVLSALTVVIAIKVVGLILVIALTYYTYLYSRKIIKLFGCDDVYSRTFIIYFYS